MDTQYTFPPPQKPAPRPAGRSANVGASGPRESSALRASVLDAALELGLVGNAGWMFDNPLHEENEEEDQTPSPGLTYGSSVTSEESIPSILSPSSSSEAHTHANAFHSSPSNRRLPPRANGYGAPPPPVPGLQRKEPLVRIIEPDFHDRLGGDAVWGQQAGVPFPESSSSSVPVRPTTPGGGRKLTKKKKATDGYESEGGYMSDAGKKKEKKKDKEKEKEKLKEKEKEKKGEVGLMAAAAATPDMDGIGLAETSKEAKKRAKEEKKEAEAERKRTKSLLSAAKAARKKDAATKDPGYETDGGGKTKSKAAKKSSADASGYDTDGTPAKKARSRFFMLGKSTSKTDLRAGAGAAEPVPPLPFPAQREQGGEAMPLPIAERFATTLSPSFFSAPTSPMPSEGRSTPLSLNPSAAPSPLPPLGFGGLASSTSSVGSPVFPDASRGAPVAAPLSAPNDRSSQFSAASSTSSGSRSRAHTEGSTSKHQGTGSATSYSTITSSVHQYQPPSSTTAFPSLSSSLSSSTSSQPGAGAKTGLGIPAISLSASRAPSPSPGRAPPVSPLSIMKGPGLRLKASLDTLIGARNATPSPVSPAPLSPYVMVPLPSPSSVTGAGLPPSPNPGKSAEAAEAGSGAGSASGSGSGFRAGFGFRGKAPSVPPLRAVISPPNTAVGSASAAGVPTTTLSPITTNSSTNISTNTGMLSPTTAESPTHLTIVPSSQYVVPSPRNSGLPSPNVLAYYDLPPPSPAPQGPLPTPPGASTAPNAHGPSHLPPPGALRQRVIDRTPRALPPELSAALHGQASVQRGRESPFPARPILPVASVPPPPAGGAGHGLEARLATRRYRELYAPLPGGGGAGAGDMERYHEEKEQAMELRRARRAGEREHSWIVDAEDDDAHRRAGEGEYAGDSDEEEDEADSQEIRGVLDRFAPEDASSAEGHPHHARALGRRRSSDALQVRARNAGPFAFEDDGRTVGDRLSRWSGSIYSRASILDADESGETRDRLVKQVEAMLDAERRGGAAPVEGERGYVPPVPRLPAAYANMGAQVNTASPGRSWNRF